MTQSQSKYIEKDKLPHTDIFDISLEPGDILYRISGGGKKACICIYNIVKPDVYGGTKRIKVLETHHYDYTNKKWVYKERHFGSYHEFINCSKLGVPLDFIEDEFIEFYNNLKTTKVKISK